MKHFSEAEGCLFFESERFVAVLSLMTCGGSFVSPTGSCVPTPSPTSKQWIVENIERAIETRQNLKGTEFQRDASTRNALKEQGFARNDALWHDIYKAYGYRNPANARASAWMVSIRVEKRKSTVLRISALMKKRNGSWEAWENQHTSRHIFLPLDSSGEKIADATLAMLAVSTLCGRTMSEVAAEKQTGNT